MADDSYIDQRFEDVELFDENAPDNDIEDKGKE
jgi:hypothetical protein